MIGAATLVEGAGASLVSLLPVIPLLGALCAYVVGLWRKDFAGIVATVASGGTFTCAAILAMMVGGDDPRVATIAEATPFTWMRFSQFVVDFTLRVDTLTACMLLVITGVGTLIHLYSIGYMSEDEGRHRYFAYLNLFLSSMILLVMGGNLLVLFVGWEGVGLCSYLLIGFWYKNTEFALAGKKAFLVNRIGDLGMLVGMFLLISKFHTLDFLELKEIVATIPLSTGFFVAVSFCFFIGAIGKSAQLPLFVWLPSAMAGPTPVSALIHAATMVTAGVYLFIRIFFIVDLAPEIGFLITAVAAATAFMAATIALVQNDIKKVLAYSTVSQLGFMFLAVGAGVYWVALFHLITHAFFKACLFLCAGSVIHSCGDEQDMRKMGGLRTLMPFTFIAYLLSTLAIAGVYPFSGYFSKHQILLALSSSSNPFVAEHAQMFGIVGGATALLTAFYMARSCFMTFFGSYRGESIDAEGHKPHEAPMIMVGPVLVLAALAVIGGWWLEGSLPRFIAAVVPVPVALLDITPLSFSAGLLEGALGSFLAVAGILGAAVCYIIVPSVPVIFAKVAGPLTFVLRGKYFVDEFYHAAVVLPLRAVAVIFAKLVERVLIDGVVDGVGATVEMSGDIARLSQSGQVRHYAFFMFMGSVGILALYFML